MAKNTTSRYTYISLGQDVIAVLEGKLEVTDEVRTRMVEKAKALIDTQTTKKEYNAKNPKKSTAKGASEETKAKANAIAQVLTDVPMTGAEINSAIGAEYTALQVANACKFIPGVESVKVIRDTVNTKGLKSQKEYTAYFIPKSE